MNLGLLVPHNMMPSHGSPVPFMHVNNVKSKTEYLAQFHPFLLLSVHFSESSEISDITLPLYFLSTIHLSPENGET
jgi:hypothetical protein